MATGQIFRAGPLEMVFLAGDLRRVRLGGREIVRRIYVAVRDRNWDTIPGRLANLSVRQQARHFAITYDSIHQQGEIDFRWRATIIGTEGGKITVAMDGKAHATFLKNRIGFCVHHPLKECSGKPCLIETADGRKERSAFPEFVSPQQPFLNVRAITHEVEAGVAAEVRFHGDVFETEDHRNWTDANYKTYGTPLSLPFPVEVKAGTEIHQMVELTLRGPVRETRPVNESAVRVRAGGQAVKLPKLGLGAATDGKLLSREEEERLKGLHLSHLRVDLDLAGQFRPLLAKAADETRRLGVKLEAAITMPGDTESLKGWAPLVERWLVFDKNEKVTSSSTVKTIRALLGPEAAVVAGTNAYFAELNRNRPAGEGWDAACFSINPQVHAFDDESVMENSAAQFDAVRSAQRFLNGRPVVVSPVTLRPRFNPNATTGVTPPFPDPRQKLPFCAAWTVGSLKSLAEAGAASVTYYETRGAGGVLDGEVTYPVYGVFEAAGEFAAGEVIPSEASDSFRVATLLLASGTRRRMLIANLTDERQTVLVDGHREPVDLKPYGVERVDWTAE